MIDWGRIDELRREVGEDAFAEVVRAFTDEVDHAVAALRGMPAPCAADFHFLRGVALGLGFTDFAAGCALAEREARAGRPVETGGLLALYDATRNAFLAGRGGAPRSGSLPACRRR